MRRLVRASAVQTIKALTALEGQKSRSVGWEISSEWGLTTVSFKP